VNINASRGASPTTFSAVPRRRAVTAFAMTAVASIALVGCAASTEAAGEGSENPIPTTNLQLATYIGPQTPYGAALEWFVDEVSEQSDGAITIEVFWEGALLNGPDVLTGVADGRADMGLTSTSYSPAELPLSQVIAVPFVSSDVVAVQNAFNELSSSNPDFQGEWSRAGVVPLTFQAVTPNIMAATSVPEDLEWIEGKSVRATSLMGNAVQDAGGNAVALALSEVYESAQRGLIDAAASLNFGTIPSVSLEEVMPHVVDPGTGVYGATVLLTNESTYAGLDDSVRAVLDDAAGGFNDVYLEQVGVFDAAACDAILDAGGSVATWSKSETDAWKDAMGDSIVDMWKSDAGASGADVEAFYEEYLELLDQTVESDYVDGVAACAER
jgi:TRAP-type C4-dicarboxylate transport system substrate-binding protein